MVCEFLASFNFAPRPADQPVELDDQWHEMSLREFAVHCGLYMVKELDTAIYTECIHIPPPPPPYDFLEVLAGD
ncbi:hypothetical protein Hanom_Chr15g01392801 [Helianthus anomalus]